jgi:DNA-binding MarR family transcriptional regulator
LQGQAADRDSTLVLDALRRIVQALRRSSRQAELEHGVSGAQLFVLRKLAAKSAPIGLGELAAETLTHLSSVSVVVTRLVERGFVTRAPSVTDARRVEIQLSTPGRKFLERASPETAQERLAQALARVPPARRALLAELLAELVKDAGFGSEDAAMFFEGREEPASLRGGGKASPSSSRVT